MNGLLSQFQQPLTPAEADGERMTPWMSRQIADRKEIENQKTEDMNDAANRLKAENNVLKATKDRARLMMEPVSNKK